MFDGVVMVRTYMFNQQISSLFSLAKMIILSFESFEEITYLAGGKNFVVREKPHLTWCIKKGGGKSDVFK